MRIKYTLLLALCALSLAFRSHAGLVLDEPVLGGHFLVAEDGEVSATFLGSNAGYFNSLFLHSPVGSAVKVFDKNDSVGDIFDLGSFSKGTELIFRLDVRNTGMSFFTGPGTRNPDGLAHVSAVTSLGDESYFTTAGFEDLYGGGDLDYNDFMFSLTNVVDPVAVAEPPMLILLTLGLLALHRIRGRSHSAPRSRFLPQTGCA